MRLSFSESDIDPRTQLSPAVNQAAADHIAEQERAAGWVDPDKTRVVPTAELQAWHAMANGAPADRFTKAQDHEKADAADGGESEDEDEKKEQKTFLGLNLHQVVGGVLASTTAAILGGQLGVAGTVVGAAMTTGIITVGGAIYTHGLNKTASRLGVAAGRFRLGGTTPLKNVPDVSADSTESLSGTEKLDARKPDQFAEANGRSWRDKISPVKLLATAAAIFLLAAVVVTGLEALRGESFSGGGQTTVGQISERSSTGSTSDSNTGATEPQREASQPAAKPTPAPETPAPTPTSDPTPTTGAVEPTAPASGSGDSSASDGTGTDGAGSETGGRDGSPSGSTGSGADSAQTDPGGGSSGQ